MPRTTQRKVNNFFANSVDAVIHWFDESPSEIPEVSEDPETDYDNMSEGEYYRVRYAKKLGEFVPDRSYKTADAKRYQQKYGLDSDTESVDSFDSEASGDLWGDWSPEECDFLPIPDWADFNLEAEKTCQHHP